MALFTIDRVKVQDILSYPRLEIQPGKATFLMGKSGTGKSTLLKLLNATLSPTEGEIRYRDKPLEDYDTLLLRREILLVAQTVFLFDDTVSGNFRQFYAYLDRPLPEEAVLQEYLRLCGADFPWEADCQTMSGGERQRVFLAIGLSLKPSVLMLDEPTSALDEQTAQLVLGNVKEHCRTADITLLVVTHDRQLAQAYGDEILSLDEGGQA